MAYFTEAELEAHVPTIFPPIVAGDVTTAIYTSVESRARNVVDSYLTLRYGVPFSDPPDRVKELSMDYASALVAEGKFGRENPAWSVGIRNVKDETITALKDIATGKANLDYDSGASVDEDSEKQILCSRVADDTVFTLDDYEAETVGSTSTW